MNRTTSNARSARPLFVPALLVALALALAVSACVTTNPDYPPTSPGTGELRIRSTSEQPAPDGETGAFRVVCDLARVAKDDPIVFPNQPGKAHLHLFFGNTGVRADSTTDSLRSSGNSTCVGGIANRSSYWIPALIDTGNGNKVLAPQSAIFYYKTGYGGVDPRTITVPPPGLQMIAGDAKTATNTEDSTHWGCLHTYIGKFSSIPTQCSAEDDLNATVIFPQCWDGRNLDSADHKSHMAFTTGRGCPSSHPVAIPEISINVRFDITPSSDVSKWRLSSDMYGTDEPGGHSLHGDWMNGWNEDVIRMFVRNCNNAVVDCHASLLGEGKEIY